MSKAKVQYDAVLSQRNTTDLDITFNEPVVFPIVDHEYSDEDVPVVTIPAYSIEEIFIEKLRSLYQRARARDYYDVYRLLNHEQLDDHVIYMALRKKAESHNVDFDLEDGPSDDDIDAVRAYWDRALSRLVIDPLPFDDVVDTIDAYLRELATHAD